MGLQRPIFYTLDQLRFFRIPAAHKLIRREVEQ
jgi:hypothetical protein